VLTLFQGLVVGALAILIGLASFACRRLIDLQLTIDHLGRVWQDGDGRRDRRDAA